MGAGLCLQFFGYVLVNDDKLGTLICSVVAPCAAKLCVHDDDVQQLRQLIGVICFVLMCKLLDSSLDIHDIIPLRGDIF